MTIVVKRRQCSSLAPYIVVRNVIDLGIIPKLFMNVLVRAVSLYSPDPRAKKLVIEQISVPFADGRMGAFTHRKLVQTVLQKL